MLTMLPSMGATNNTGRRLSAQQPNQQHQQPQSPQAATAAMVVPSVLHGNHHAPSSLLLEASKKRQSAILVYTNTTDFSNTSYLTVMQQLQKQQQQGGAKRIKTDDSSSSPSTQSHSAILEPPDIISRQGQQLHGGHIGGGFSDPFVAAKAALTAASRPVLLDRPTQTQPPARATSRGQSTTGVQHCGGGSHLFSSLIGSHANPNNDASARVGGGRSSGATTSDLSQLFPLVHQRINSATNTNSAYLTGSTCSSVPSSSSSRLTARQRLATILASSSLLPSSSFTGGTTTTRGSHNLLLEAAALNSFSTGADRGTSFTLSQLQQQQELNNRLLQRLGQPSQQNDTAMLEALLRGRSLVQVNPSTVGSGNPVSSSVGEGADLFRIYAALSATGAMRTLTGQGGPFCLPVTLSILDDERKLSEQQVFLRCHIEAFQAGEDDVSTHTRGRNKPIMLGQVGIRCRFCAHLPVVQKQKGSTYFPATLLGLYQAAQNMSTTHMQSGLCREMPPNIKEKFANLSSMKVASSGAGRPYWALAAKKLGLVDTEDGIRFSQDLHSRR